MFLCEIESLIEFRAESDGSDVAVEQRTDADDRCFCAIVRFRDT
jgi:hypothetical protein